ncbi:SUMF1/EgtB/PvdO family nonheme iron enzyme [Brumimicrobium aurantiacum]|uniref:SUMF1/EgtB/PvdO family nonheme iron enzyme n=1 Tax=Brumimicrobium aurantiacum TaxID=1737063 RepID=UPI00196B3373|nr:SUMF1/EgtB/PvdO family nonheme iron enzyme [Brumimicrobium aurantiacum]
MKRLTQWVMAIGAIAIVSSCSRETSNTTGWDYNNPGMGGFQKVPFVDQETGPGLILVQGGTFTMGRVEDDVMYDWNNRPRRVTVSSFYMDQTEVTNFHWNEYLYWLHRAYNGTYPMVYKNALPDTLVWRSKLGFNEKYVDYYLRHPAYRDYPVVGVSWLQANDYCKWRTDRVNEYLLIREGILDFNINQTDETTFNTEAYLNGKGDESIRQNLTDLNPSKLTGKRGNELGERRVRMSDGILLPRYRLPTEAEWEFAYYGLIGNLKGEDTEVISSRRIYPWDGHYVRQDNEEFQGEIRANFRRSRGDYMGVAGNLNDGADVTAPVDHYWPNDNGLYNMAGNVAEWVLDVYRPLSSEDVDDFRPFRGNVFQTKVLNYEGAIDEKNFQTEYDVHGMKEYLNEFERIRFQRVSAAKHDPDDDVITDGIMKTNESKNPVARGYAPDPYYVSHNSEKDKEELRILKEINAILDKAVEYKNDKLDAEASMYVQENLFEGIFIDEFREGDLGGEYAYEIISILRDGFADYMVETPGKLKYRDVTEEENIGRLNYRRADYIDYLDGDIESSIHYDNTERMNDINQARRDPELVMYQSEHEEYDLKGSGIKPGGPDDRTAWPTTLVSNKSRVYKGGSWKDRAYWMVGGNRRFLDEDQATDYIGFRCAMDRIGSPGGMNQKTKRK